MDLKHKHGAVIWAVLLGVVFLGLLIWYMASSPAPVVPTIEETPEPAFMEPDPSVIEESGTYYEISAEYPSDTPLPEAYNAAAIATLRSFIDERIAEFKGIADFENLTPEDAAAMGLFEGRMYALGLEYELYTSPTTVSYVYTVYEDTLGAHPNTYFRTFTFDTTTGAALSLPDLFTPTSSYLSWLSERSRRDIPLIVQQRSGYLPDSEYLASGTEPKVESFQSFYLDGDTFVIAYPPYQVGPYALGSILVPIPRTDLESLLRPEYQVD